VAPKLPVYAHRLGGRYGPESSPAALSRTLSQPVDGLEADVVLTADDKVVVLHDPGLSLSTDLEGWAHELPADELLKARILDRAGEPSDQRPMLLIELVERIPPEMPLELDVKAYVDQDLVRRTVEHACDVLHRHGTVERAEIASFFTLGCRVARARGVAARLIVWGDYAPQALGRWAVQRGIRGVAFEGFVFSRELRETLTAFGLTAQVGAVNSAAQLERLLPLAPDIIVSDSPHEIAAELARMAPQLVSEGDGPDSGSRLPSAADV
jgi:glycerophosphoryl diester phosphodiesterase